MKFLSLIFLMVATLGVNAQNSLVVSAPLYNSTNTYTLARLIAATATRDTITNTGLGVLTTKRTGGTNSPVTIEVYVTKVSGTVAGTIALQGSLDGTNFKGINTSETQTAIATATLTDATNSYSWRLSTSPYLYYRVSASGGTTTVYYLDARIYKH